MNARALAVLADVRTRRAQLVRELAELDAQALEREAELLRQAAQESEKTTTPLMGPVEAVALFGATTPGETYAVTLRRLYRVTARAPFRREFSRTDIRFDRAGFMTWLAGRGKKLRAAC